jgi:DNA-binding response OmpR family regulator
VVVLQWPDDATEVQRLAAGRIPRLLLVRPEADPPAADDCEQDWVRLPADPRDLGARLAALGRRARRHQALPEIDEHGRLHLRGQWVPTSPIEQRLLDLLVERFGAVVPGDDLRDRAWPGQKPSGTALRVHMTRLKRRIAPLGLDIRGVRPASYVLEERS